MIPKEMKDNTIYEPMAYLLVIYSSVSKKKKKKKKKKKHTHTIEVYLPRNKYLLTGYWHFFFMQHFFYQAIVVLLHMLQVPINWSMILLF